MSQLTYFRRSHVDYILATAAEGESLSIVGLSNTGKSMLLRTACRRDVQAHVLGERADRFALIYVDCNLMLTLTAQGFYEVTLRAVQETLKQIGASDDLLAHMGELYRKVVEPPSDFAVPLSFNDAIDLLSQNLDRHIVFLFDEFDEPFARLDSRVFLNLRALSDKFGRRLSYVVATTTPLASRNIDSDVGEFVELFVGHQRRLGMLNAEESRVLAAEIAGLDGVNLHRQELDFVVEQAGGHAGLLQAVTRVVLDTVSGAPEQSRADGLALARERLEDDQIARAECTKVWNALSEVEREALIDVVLDPLAAPATSPRGSLAEKGVLIADGSLRPFSAHFAGFVRRQRRTRQTAQAGVWVDIDSGKVAVDGREIATLTDLEYRLLLLLWGRLDKLCDKFQIVENVWGQEYIDEVDDARIEKLVSRLRAKLEQDPANPRYLQTVRGRGYRLVGV